MKLFTPQRIFVVTPTYGLSGVPLAQIRLARSLAEEKHHVTLVIGNNLSSLKLPFLPNVNVLVLDKSRVLYMFIPLLKLFSEYKPQIIFSAEDHLNTLVSIICLFSNSKAKVCASSRVTPYDTYSDVTFSKRWLLKKLANIFNYRLDLMTCVSKEMVLQYRNIFPESKHKCVYNIVIDKYSSLLKKEPVDHKWLLNKRYPVIVAAGMLEPWKGFDVLLRAFSLLYPRINSRLIILGDGSLRTSLTQLSASLSIDKFVDFVGYKDNPLAYFSKSDVFVLSSLVEGMPNVLIEAMFCGCTPVSTNCPTGPGEVIKDNLYGYLCPVGNHKIMSTKIEEAIKNPISQDVLLEGVRPFERLNILNLYSRYLSIPLTSIT